MLRVSSFCILSAKFKDLEQHKKLRWGAATVIGSFILHTDTVKRSSGWKWKIFDSNLQKQIQLELHKLHYIRKNSRLGNRTNFATHKTLYGVEIDFR